VLTFQSAGSGSRTRTPLLAYAPETYASTNSAIPANNVVSKAAAKVRRFFSSPIISAKRAHFFVLRAAISLIPLQAIVIDDFE
jgi:hypothetical protein